MSKSNLFESIELVFWLQRIFCILPLKWNGSTELLKTTLLMKLHVYGIIAMILLITYQSIFTWNCADHLRKFLPKGELWTILFSYAFIAIYIHFLLNILYFFINRPKHIEVLKLFHSIDNRFRIKFRQEVNHRKHKRQINIGITLISLYYLFSLISGTIYWYLTDQVVMIPIHFVYDFERVSLHLPTYMSINYILLIRARSEHLLKVYGPLQSKYNNYLKNGGADRIVLNHFSIELDKVIELFKKTCSLFNICIASFGWSNLLQIARLFTSIAMEIYILWTFSMGKTTGGAAVPYFMIYSLFGELVNLGIHTIVLGAAFSTVRISWLWMCFCFCEELNRNWFAGSWMQICFSVIW